MLELKQLQRLRLMKLGLCIEAHIEIMQKILINTNLGETYVLNDNKYLVYFLRWTGVAQLVVGPFRMFHPRSYHIKKPRLIR